jgi:aminomethyltransferase
MTNAIVERLAVAGGGALRFALSSGDRVRVVDPEGLQPALLHLSDPAAVPDLAADDAGTIALLSADGPAGQSAAFAAAGAVECTIEAPGAPMTPDTQAPPTELTLVIQRAGPADAPPPHAEMILL